MKGKYWIIKSSENIYECLKYIGLHDDYIPLIMHNQLDYLIVNEEYICLYYSYNDNHFRWTSYEDRFYLMKKGFKFEGKINLRKAKLEKLNAKFR